MSTKEILILNFGSGNFSSISKMINAVGGTFRIGSSADEINKSGKIILPGVGHFDRGMSMLKSANIDDAIKERVSKSGIPILGICLGMQLLCSKSEEGVRPGLGLINADVKKLIFSKKEKLKVPHMGWNVVRSVIPNPLIENNDEEKRYYFAHSYYVEPDDVKVVIGTTNYGNEFCSAFQKDNIFGVQFHPEKSHRFGMSLMKRFVEL